MKTKFRLGAIPLGLFILWMTACGTAAPSDLAATGSGRGNQPLPRQTELALGILRLEGTPQAVDAETAAQLLPIWQLLEKMNASSTAAPQEINAVVEAIEAALAPARVDAIAALHLTQADLFAYLQQTGMMPARSGMPSAGSRRGNGNSGPPGGMPAGGPMNPPGGGEGFQPGAIDPAMRATLEARSVPMQAENLPLPLRNALIQYLEKLARPTPSPTA